MRKPAREESSPRQDHCGGVEIHGGIVIQVVGVERHGSMVKDHQDHDQAAHPVNRGNALRNLILRDLALDLRERLIRYVDHAFDHSQLPVTTTLFLK